MLRSFSYLCLPNPKLDSLDSSQDPGRLTALSIPMVGARAVGHRDGHLCCKQPTPWVWSNATLYSCTPVHTYIHTYMQYSRASLSRACFDGADNQVVSTCGSMRFAVLLSHAGNLTTDGRISPLFPYLLYFTPLASEVFLFLLFFSGPNRPQDVQFGSWLRKGKTPKP